MREIPSKLKSIKHWKIDEAWFFVKTVMQAVMKTEPRLGAELRSHIVPMIRPNEVLVEVLAASICGTDVHIYRWNEWAASRVKLPLIIGHEFAGRVIEAGTEVVGLTPGDVVSGETHIACGHCYQCRTGNAHICENMLLRGVDSDGCFAELHALPQQSAWRNSKDLPVEAATAQEPLGNAVNAVFESDVSGKNVAVFGCGPIGLCAVALCRAFGATQVIAIDIVEYRLRLARSMGAHVMLNGKADDVVKDLQGLTNGQGVDVLLEMSGSEAAYRQGFRALRPGGKATLFGLPNKPVSIDVARDIVFKDVTIRGIYGRKMFDTWYKTAAILKAGLVDLSKIITHRFKLEEFRDAFELMASGECGKVVLVP